MADDANGAGQNGRWQKWTAIITAVIATSVFAVGMLWKVFIISSAIDTGEARNAEVQRRLSDVEMRLAKSDQDQTGARVTDLQRRLSALEDRVARNDLDLNSMRRDFIEIETQFCEEDNVRNVNSRWRPSPDGGPFRETVRHAVPGRKRFLRPHRQMPDAGQVKFPGFN